MSNTVDWTKTELLTEPIAAAFWQNPNDYLTANAKTLKDSGFHRNVLLLNAQSKEQKILVKHFTFKSTSEKMKWTASLDPAHKEWNILTALIKEKAPVPKPLAFGFQQIGAVMHVWLLIEFVDNIITFDQRRPPTSIAKLKKGAISLGHALAKIHIAGVWHGDMHSGNLLFMPENNQWLITDFQHSRLGAIGKAEMIQDLTQLHHCLGKKVPLAIRLTFLKAYLECIAEITNTKDVMEGNEWKDLFTDVRNKCNSYSIIQAKKRTKRCLHSNRDFAKLDKWMTLGTLPKNFEQGWIARNTSQQLTADLIDLIADKSWFLNKDVHVLKNTGSACVGIYSHPQGKLFVKQYRYKKSKFPDRVRSLLHRSKAHIAWQSSYHLQLLHLKTPKSIMVLWEPNGGFLVQEFIPELTTADLALQSLAQPKDARQRRKLIYRLAQEVSLMHDRAIAHRDLKGSNLAVSNPDSDKVSVFLIDVHPIKFHTYLPWSARIKDLSRLFAALFPFSSSTEQRYFLRIYMKFQSASLDIHQLIYDVRLKAESKLLEKHGIQI